MSGIEIIGLVASGIGVIQLWSNIAKSISRSKVSPTGSARFRRIEALLSVLEDDLELDSARELSEAQQSYVQESLRECAKWIGEMSLVLEHPRKSSITRIRMEMKSQALLGASEQLEISLVAIRDILQSRKTAHIQKQLFGLQNAVSAMNELLLQRFLATAKESSASSADNPAEDDHKDGLDPAASGMESLSIVKNALQALIKEDGVKGGSEEPRPKLEELAQKLGQLILQQSQSSNESHVDPRCHPFIIPSTNPEAVTEVRAQAIIDSGCLDSWINTSVLERGPHTFEPTLDSAPRIGFGGASARPEGMATITWYSTNQALTSVRTFLVCRDIPCDVILGWDYISDHLGGDHLSEPALPAMAFPILAPGEHLRLQTVGKERQLSNAQIAKLQQEQDRQKRQKNREDRAASRAATRAAKSATNSPFMSAVASRQLSRQTSNATLSRTTTAFSAAPRIPMMSTALAASSSLSGQDGPETTAGAHDKEEEDDPAVIGSDGESVGAAVAAA